MNKKAIVTGVTGQTGSFMAELLLAEGMDVIGVHRRTSQPNLNNLKICLNHPNFTLVEGDLLDYGSISSLIYAQEPDYFFNYAAQSHVKTSFDQPLNTLQINTIGVANILDSILRFSPETKMLQASSSEQFGNNYTTKYTARPWETKVQDENTQFMPRSPYAVSKTAAHQLCYTYREAYGLYIVCSICFNHESPRRGTEFVTRKITKWIAKNHFPTLINQLSIPDDQKLRLGNLDSKRDWGHAKDYCIGMRLMMEQDKKPEDFVICTGETHSIREFLDKAFISFGIKDWNKYVMVDPLLYRPAEVDYLCGDNQKIKNKLGWSPKYNLDTLIAEMLESDLNNG